MTKITLLDGGMGQELLKRSSQPSSPLWSAQVLIDEPDIVEAVHLDYIRAGARVITLNSYSLTPERLERDGDIGAFEQLQARAIKIAKSARDKSSENVSIAGCLPPLVSSYRPDVAPEFDICLETYRKIVGEQCDGVDLFICETLASVKEVRAATVAAAESGKTVWTAMTLKDEKNAAVGPMLRSGEPLEEGIMAAINAEADAILVNCSWPETLTNAIGILAGGGLPIGAYANGFESIDKMVPGGTVDELSAREDLGPQAYADFAMSWIDGGATIVGGCCETGPEHIKQIAARLESAGFEITGVINE
jgi:homocysteine S-methyltransferase